jgi:ferredoxin, 2Fe-2S
MPQITYEHADGTSDVVDVPVGESVMRGAVLNGIDGIVAECGGAASCGTCHVFVREADADRLPEVSDLEDDILFCTAEPRRPNSRLSCQLRVDEDFDGLVVTTPSAQQ